MTIFETTVFVTQPNTNNDDTQEIIPVKVFEIVLTVVESANPYLNGKQTRTPIS